MRFEILRRFGVFPGSGDHHSVEFMPGFVHPGNDYGSGWRVHHYGMEGHRADAGRRRRALRVGARRDRRDAHAVGRARRARCSTAWSPARPRHAAGEPAERGQRHEPRPTARSSRSWASPTASGVRGRDQATVPGIMGEFLRRINVVQEWTVEAAITGDRTLVLEAMMADPMAGQLAYDDIVDDDRRDARRHRPLAPAVP